LARERGKFLLTEATIFPPQTSSVLRKDRGSASETLGYFILNGAQDYEPFPEVRWLEITA